MKLDLKQMLFSRKMEQTKTNMTTYTFLYNCPRWYATVTGVRNLVHDGTEDEVVKSATEIAKHLSGSETCDIKLLQKFHMSLRLSEPYPALVQFPLSTVSK